MALTYTQRKTLKNNPLYRDRLSMAINAAAINIADDVPVGQLNIDRDKAARRCLSDPNGVIEPFAVATANQFAAKTQTDGTDITDAELDTAVAGVFNDVLIIH